MARKKQRENYGNGSVSPVMVTKEGKKIQERDKQGKPIWRVCITLGIEEYVANNGRICKRQIKKQKRVHGTLDEARQIAARLTAEYKYLNVNKAMNPFSELCEEWLGSDCCNCSNSQKKQYRTRLSYMANCFGDKRLIDIVKQDVKSAISAIQNRQDGKKLAPTTLKKILSVTNRVFEYALDEDYIGRNPCRGVRLPIPKDDKPKKEKRALGEEEVFNLRVALDKYEEKAYEEFNAKEQRQNEWGHAGNRSSLNGFSLIGYLTAARLLLVTGARRGEILGLTWRNVDLEKGIIRISQSRSVEGRTKSTKTDAGIRNLYIDEFTLEHLRTWSSFQKQALEHITVEGKTLVQDEETPVFTSDSGTWADPNNYSRWWRSFSKLVGLEGFTTHEFRHTQITRLRARNIPEDMIQTRVGHARRTTVTDQYAHEMPARDKLAADVIGEIAYGKKNKKKRIVKLRKTAA